MKRRLAMVTALAALLMLGSLVSPVSALDEADRLFMVGERALADRFYPVARRTLERFVAQYPKDRAHARAPRCCWARRAWRSTSPSRRSRRSEGARRSLSGAGRAARGEVLGGRGALPAQALHRGADRVRRGRARRRGLAAGPRGALRLRLERARAQAARARRHRAFATSSAPGPSTRWPRRPRCSWRARTSSSSASTRRCRC